MVIIIEPCLAAVEYYNIWMEAYESREFQGHKKSVFSLDWNSEGSRLASASSDGSIRIWGLGEGALEKGGELRGHSDMIEQIAFSP